MSRNLFELFEQCVETYPEKTAIVCKDTTLSYADFYSRVKTLAYHFNRIGLDKGSHLGIFENNSIEFAVIMMACACLGVTMVPLPMTLKGRHLEKGLGSSHCGFVIGRKAVMERILQKNLYPPGQLITLGGRLDTCWCYDDFLKHCEEFHVSYEVPKDTHYILTMTSGSTGDPKPIIFSQETKIIRALTATKEVYGLDSQDVVLVSTPLYHSLAQRSLILPLIMGGSAVILSRFTPAIWMEHIEKYKITFLFAVSSQLAAVVQMMNHRTYDISSLHTIVSSSALLQEDVKEKLLALFHCNVYECYGTSEVGVVTSLLIRERPGSVGKPLPFVDMKIVNGQILCKSITEFKGYYNSREATRDAYDEQGYFCTGDVGEVDANGYLYYKGRIKDIIKTGAITVYPQDIEEIIRNCESVEDCAVIGMEDDHFGEVIVAVMTQAQGHTIDISEIRKACLANLIDYQIPHGFQIVDAFPRSGLGKIMKGQLKEQLHQKSQEKSWRIGL